MALWGKAKAETKRPEPAIGTGAPIKSSQQDLLGRGGFAAALADVIANENTDESLVLALRGEWGAGKSSLKNLVIEKLRQKHGKAVRVLEFNPWRWTGDDAISRAFFREIAAALGEADKSLEGRRRAEALRRYAAALGHVSNALKAAHDKVPTTVGWLTSLGLLTAGAGLLLPGLPVAKVAAGLLIASGALGVTGKVLSALGHEWGVNRSLDLIRTDLEDKLKTLRQNLLVVIDDIDRLEPEQIRLVVRHVKANANLPRITYLLLFQREIVEEALNPIANNEGGKYLEKIIQASFDIPAVEGARIEGVVLGSLDAIVGKLPEDSYTFDQTRWGNVWQGALKTFFHTLRDAHRYSGSVGVHINLHLGAKVLETNLVDLLAIEALRVFEPDLFEELSHSKHLLTGFNNSPETKDAIVRMLERVAGENRDAVQDMFERLFPMAEWAFGGGSYGAEWAEQWSKERRICSARHFDRYFALRLPDGQISDSEFLDFLERSSDRQTIDEAFADLERRGLLPVLLNRLDEINRSLPLGSAPSLLPALFDVGDRFANEPVFVGSTPYISAWRTASWYLQSEPEADLRGSLFLGALRNSSGLAVPNMLLNLEDDRRTGRSAKPCSLTDDQLAEAKAILLNKLREQAKASAEWLGHKHFIALMYAWKRLAGDAEPEAWAKSVVADSKLLPRLLAAFMTESVTSTMGDLVARRQRAFDLKVLEPFVDLATLDEAARSLDESLLDEQGKTVRKAVVEAIAEHVAEAGADSPTH